MGVLWKPRKFTASMVQMKPTVPNTRMGGKSLTVSRPAPLRAEKATELLSAMVGM